MSGRVDIGFEERRVDLPLKHIHPAKVVTPALKKTKKYQQIATSIQEVGVVEPLMVHQTSGLNGKFLLLDGHLRLEALKSLNAAHAPCLVAKDDEAFTYNKRINRLSNVQEHHMILKAVENGASEATIAQALGVSAHRIREKKNLLKGICAEALEILKDRPFPNGSINVMKRVKPLRQVEMAELMVAVNNFSIAYARALFMTTPEEQLKEPEKKKPVAGLSEHERQRMEQEMANLTRDMKAIEEDYGTNMLRLVVANGYVTHLLENDQVADYLSRRHSDLLLQLQRMTQSIASDTGLMPQAPQ